MASYTVAQAEIGVYQKTLVATTVDTVTITRDENLERLIPTPAEVWSDGTAAIYFTIDGTTPVVGANATYEIPAGVASVKEVQGAAPGNLVVKLISAGTPKYSVSVS